MPSDGRSRGGYSLEVRAPAARRAAWVVVHAAAHPEYAPAWETRAHAMESRGDLVGALRAYDRQIALDPAASERRFNRCNVLARLDALPEAGH